MPSKKAIQISYENVKALVHDTVWRFWEQYKGDLEELHSQGVEYFFEAFLTYDPEKAEFSTWVRRIVWCRLLDGKRKEAKFSRVLKKTSIDMENVIGRMRKFDLDQLYTQLSLDGCYAVDKALFPSFSMRKEILKRGTKVKTIRKIIKEELKREGWSSDRVHRAFEEVRKTL